jgi:putative beta-barrel porin MtrB/PioB
MNTLARTPRLRPTILALALLAAFGTVRAQSSSADGSVSFGLGLAGGDSADRALFGQYNGMRDRGTVGLLGVEYKRSNEAAGTSTRLQGIDLLGETRELDFRWKKQGDWKFGADYRQQVRHDPNSVSTGADLTMKRTGLGVSFAKIISPAWQFDASLSSENKTGARLFGIGFSCPSAVAPGCRGTTGTETGWALLMLPEPINANHSQVEARLSYAGEKLRLSVGYHGSFYRNAYGSIDPNVPSSLNNPVGTPLPLSTGLQAILSQPVALPPDNQSHHLDIAGTYALSRTTQLNFRLGRAQSFQHQDFVAAGLSGAPAGINELGGRVDTTLAQVGISSRPTPKLSLLAKLRHEERDDRTPLALYNVEDTATYTNRRLPSTRPGGGIVHGHFHAHAGRPAARHGEAAGRLAAERKPVAAIERAKRPRQLQDTECVRSAKRGHRPAQRRRKLCRVGTLERERLRVAQRGNAAPGETGCGHPEFRQQEHDRGRGRERQAEGKDRGGRRLVVRR